MAPDTRPNREIRSARLRFVSLCHVVALVFSLGVPSPGTAGGDVVSPTLQVVLFAKIFAYNKSLVPPLKVVIVFAKEFSTMGEEVQRTFAKSGQPSVLVPIADFVRHPVPGSVIYVLANSVPSVVQELCSREHIFSVSPVSGLAERGEVSVAVGLNEDGKPEIVVHLRRAKLEGQDLLMQLLSLARVIR